MQVSVGTGTSEEAGYEQCNYQEKTYSFYHAFLCLAYTTVQIYNEKEYDLLDSSGN